MRGGTFLYRFEAEEGATDAGLYFLTLDRKTGEVTSVSERLASFTTITGETFSLIPHQRHPWFQYEDTTRGRLCGRLHNYPTARAIELFVTDTIATVKTLKGDVIDTLLTLTSSPHRTQAEEKSPAKGLEALFRDLLAESLDELDGSNEKQKKIRPRRNDAGDKGSAPTENQPRPQ